MGLEEKGRKHEDRLEVRAAQFRIPIDNAGTEEPSLRVSHQLAQPGHCLSPFLMQDGGFWTPEQPAWVDSSSKGQSLQFVLVPDFRETLRVVSGA